MWKSPSQKIVGWFWQGYPDVNSPVRKSSRSFFSLLKGHRRNCFFLGKWEAIAVRDPDRCGKEKRKETINTRGGKSNRLLSSFSLSSLLVVVPLEVRRQWEIGMQHKDLEMENEVRPVPVVLILLSSCWMAERLFHSFLRSSPSRAAPFLCNELDQLDRNKGELKMVCKCVCLNAFLECFFYSWLFHKVALRER